MRMPGEGSRSDEGVAAGERDREHPHRHHRREIERGDAGAYAQGLAHRPAVDAAADLLGELALHQMRDAAGELDDLQAAGDLALGIGQGLAVLGGDQPRQRVAVAFQQLAEFEQHARAGERRGRGPAGKRRGGGSDCPIDLVRARESDAAAALAARRVEDLAPAPARPFHLPAADVMLHVAHQDRPHRPSAESRIIGAPSSRRQGFCVLGGSLIARGGEPLASDRRPA
jgi:hypothetical protein